MGWIQSVFGTLTLVSDELAAKKARDEMRLLSQARGYADKDIDELMELRMLLEYRATEVIDWPVMLFVNPYYDPKLKKYLENVPDDVILPEEDLPWLRWVLPATGSSA